MNRSVLRTVLKSLMWAGTTALAAFIVYASGWGLAKAGYYLYLKDMVRAEIAGYKVGK